MVANFEWNEENIDRETCTIINSDCMWDAKTMGNAIVESAKELDFVSKNWLQCCLCLFDGAQRGYSLSANSSRIRGKSLIF